MTIKIEGLTGPHEGKVYEFDQHTPIILFGRSKSAQVNFDDTSRNKGISRHHVELKLETDRYHILLQDDNPVFLDGKEAHEGDEIELGSHTLSLGDPNGPTYRITTQSQDAHLAETAPIYKKKKTAREAAKTGFKKVTLAIAAVVVVSVLGYQFLFQKTEELKLDMALVSEQLANTASDDDFGAILREKRASVYLVAARKDGLLSGSGTAWVTENGLMATNAHVFDGVMKAIQDGDADSAVVVSTQPPYRQHEILSGLSHPDYARFLMHQQANPKVLSNNQQLSLVPGYDVAIMEVSDKENLAPPLKLAANNTLYSLDSGQTIAFIGFPLELFVGGGTNYEQPTPQVQIGEITSVTDYFLTGGDQFRNHLIQHNLPAHGGASGSPILNRDGEVVGLLSAVSFFVFENGLRIATGVGINFGQRVDLLNELINDTHQNIQAERNAFWGDRLAEYRDPFDVLLSQFKSEIGKGKEQLIYSAEHAANYDSRLNANAWMYELSGSNTNRDLYIVAQSLSGTNIDITVFDGRARMLAQDNYPNSYPFTLLEHGRSYDSSLGTIIFVTAANPGDRFKVSIYSIPR